MKKHSVSLFFKNYFKHSGGSTSPYKPQVAEQTIRVDKEDKPMPSFLRNFFMLFLLLS